MFDKKLIASIVFFFVAAMTITGTYFISQPKASACLTQTPPSPQCISQSIGDVQRSVPEQIVAAVGIVFKPGVNIASARSTILSKYNAQEVVYEPDISVIYIRLNGVTNIAETNAKIVLISTEVAIVESAKPSFYRKKLAVTPGDEGSHDPISAYDPYLYSASLNPPRDQWGIKKTRTQFAWYHAKGSSETVIGVIDTGVHSSHEDMSGKVKGCYNAINRSTTCADPDWHGTAVSGIIAATTNNGKGISAYCWLCRVFVVRDGGMVNTQTAHTVAAINYLSKRSDIKIINISGSGADEDGLYKAVKKAYDRGKVIVSSAGNEGNSVKQYPAAYAEVISVAGTDPNDAIFADDPPSSYGPWVTVAAPNCSSMLLTPSLGNYTARDCGTSFAAPAIAGILGLVQSLGNGSKSPSWYKNCLKTSFDPVSNNANSTLVQTGRIEAHAAVLNALLDPSDCNASD